MTEQTADAARLASFVPAETDQEMQVSCRHTIRRLTLAQHAMNLAIRTAHRAPYEGSSLPLTPDQTLADWRAANLMVDAVFSRLNFEVSNAIDMMQRMLPPR